MIGIHPHAAAGNMAGPSYVDRGTGHPQNVTTPSPNMQFLGSSYVQTSMGYQDPYNFTTTPPMMQVPGSSYVQNGMGYRDPYNYTTTPPMMQVPGMNWQYPNYGMNWQYPNYGWANQSNVNIGPTPTVVAGLWDWRVKPGYEELYQAVMKDDWEAANDLFTRNPAWKKEKISERDDTILHIAAEAGLSSFVKNLLDLLEPEDLVIKNKDGNTAFCLVAASGNVELAEMMQEKNENLHKIPGKNDILPIDMADGSDMVNYLLNLQERESDSVVRITRFHKLITSGLYDKALDLLRENSKLATARFKANEENAPEMATTRVESNEENAPHTATARVESNQENAPKMATSVESNEENAKSVEVNALNTATARVESNEVTTLYLLVRQLTFSPNFDNQDQQGVLKRFFKPWSDKFCRSKLPPEALELVKEVWEKVKNSDDASETIEQLLPLLFVAAAKGYIELLTIIIPEYLQLVWSHDDNQRSLFDVAILYRQKDIFKLLNKIPPAHKNQILRHKDKDGNNILHFAAMLAPLDRLNIVPDAALQLQQDILWFKEVRKIVDPSTAEARNKQGKTPRDLFNEQHKYLKVKRETWIKDTANSCMIVATLIATVVFAAAFTIPGGTKEDTGNPYVIQKATFIIFIISDAVSLVSSTCSIITFLSILTSQYEDDEFLSELPTKLILGLGTLLLSIAAMMAVFGATIFIVFKDGVLWVPILVSTIAFVPVIFFLMQHLRLFCTILVLTGRSDSLLKIVENRRSLKTRDLPV